MKNTGSASHPLVGILLVIVVLGVLFNAQALLEAAIVIAILGGLVIGLVGSISTIFR